MIQINPNRKIENDFPDSTPKTATDKFTTLDGGLVNSLTVEMTPVQDLHGQSKPWAGGAGKNIVPFALADLKTKNTTGTWSDNVYTTNGVTFEVLSDDDGNINGIKANRVSSSSGDAFFNFVLNDYSFLTPGISYTLNGCPSGGSNTTYALVYFEDNSHIYWDSGSGVTFTVGTIDVNTVMRVVVRSGYSPSNMLFKPMVRLSSIADPTFEPYSNICPISGHTEAKAQINETVYTTSLGTTVYGGEVDMVSGEGETNIGIIDLSTLTWTAMSTPSVFRANITDIKTPTNDLKCTIYKTDDYSIASSSMDDMAVKSHDNDTQPRIYVKDTRYTTVSDLTTGLSGVMLTYPLATPTTLTLTGQNITAEVGENNVSAPLDGQEIQTDGVTYKEMFSWADVVAYVQSQVNP